MDVFQEEGGPGEPMDCDCNTAPMGCDETSRCLSQGPVFGGPDLMSTFDDSDESDEEPDDDVNEVDEGEDIFMTLLQSHLWAGLLEEQDEADECGNVSEPQYEQLQPWQGGGGSRLL